MYIGTGEESFLLKCLKPRARASRDALLPISAWRTFPSVLWSHASASQKDRRTCCSN
uniref:Uncharacterized protein n=1 Tax=Ailuropoda melanoleuca TaxID=9646 RepID=A0A7N5JNQ9_AILME